MAKSKSPTHPKKVGKFKIGDSILYQGESYKIDRFTKFIEGKVSVGIIGQSMSGGCDHTDMVNDTPNNREIARIMINEWSIVYDYPLAGLNHPRLSAKFATFFVEVCKDAQNDCKDNRIEAFRKFIQDTYVLLEQAKKAQVDGVKIFR